MREYEIACLGVFCLKEKIRAINGDEIRMNTKNEH